MQTPWLYDVLTLTRQAGQATLAFHPSKPAQSNPVRESSNSKPSDSHSNLNVRHKADDSPVTAADLRANEIIVQGLQVITPEVPIVSEECPGSEQHLTKTGRFWLVDPLDGTKGFVRGDDAYTVNLALVDQGVSVWGVVYAPIGDQLYWGGLKTGSFLSDAGVERVLHVEPLDQLPITPRVLASRSHLGPNTQDLLNRLGSIELMRAGSSIKLCWIAQGLADFYPRLGMTSQWDIAAAQAVLEGAGGFVCDLQGRPLRYGQRDLLNPEFVASRIHYVGWQHLL